MFVLLAPFTIFVTMKIGAVRHSQVGNRISVCLSTHLSLSLHKMNNGLFYDRNT